MIMNGFLNNMQQKVGKEPLKMASIVLKIATLATVMAYFGLELTKSVQINATKC